VHVIVAGVEVEGRIEAVESRLCFIRFDTAVTLFLSFANRRLSIAFDGRFDCNNRNQSPLECVYGFQTVKEMKIR
jgi:hypothetical protein